jgi:hypothetical protein
MVVVGDVDEKPLEETNESDIGLLFELKSRACSAKARIA